MSPGSPKVKVRAHNMGPGVEGTGVVTHFEIAHLQGRCTRMALAGWIPGTSVPRHHDIPGSVLGSESKWCVSHHCPEGLMVWWIRGKPTAVFSAVQEAGRRE